ncbi:MAG: T9SS type A sorting domain-containing protein [Ferruginibacter sp.]
MRKIVQVLLLLIFCLTGYAQFTPGNLALLQADASASNTTCSVIEINNSSANQSAVTTVPIIGTGATALRFSGSATSTGYLANTNDGSLLCFSGVNTTNTASNINTLNPRAVGTLNAAQIFNLPTTYTGASGNQTRGATAVDNSNWFIADQGGIYTNSTVTANPSGNFRSIKSFGAAVYVSSASSTATVIQVNTISAPSGGSLTGLPGLTNNANLQDFYLISSGNNGNTYDILYVLAATSNTAGSISKFSLVSGSWTANGTYTTSFGGFGIAAQTVAGGANLYVSTGQGALTANSVIRLNDAAGFNTAIAITTANNITLYTAPAGKIIKGVAFAPLGGVVNNLSLAFSTSTTAALNPPYVSGTINDVADPAQQQGIVVDVKENNISIAAANYTLTASGSNTTVVPNANIVISKTDGQATIKITPAAAGYDDITLTLTSNGNNKTLVIHYAASLSASSSAGTHWHTGFGDASGAIAIDDNYMIVCNDENNLLYVYHRDQSGLPVKSFDFNQGNILGLTDGAPDYKEVDVEAGTSSPITSGKTYWLGSMSNSSSFNNKPNRNRIFAITSTGTGAATSFANAGSYNNLRQQLISWGDVHGYNFTASAADGHDAKVIDGFNLEGMVFGPDNSTLYLGFRAPLVPLANRTKAVIAPIQNFETWFNNGSPAGNAVIGSPIEIDLGGRGIRDIIRWSNGIYIIIAGSYDGTSNPAIYSWTGNPADAPLLTDFNVTGLNVEGALQVNTGGILTPTKLQVINDDGDKIYYNDGIAAKDLTQDNYKKFSSDISLSSGVVAVEFISFNAGIQNNNVLLNWQVGNADDLNNFEIFRSINGIDFVSIANINAVRGQMTYFYTDNNIAAQKIYYRIKAIEKSNHPYLSAIRIVSLQSQAETVLVYPNPVTDNLLSVAVSKTGNKKLEIYTAAGALYKTIDFTGNVKDINTATWSKGYYLMRITLSDGTTTIKKLLIQ